ncbi:hypothetical protein OG936_03055 [Streptomyces sp. NBC_00846]|uniref:hypothetical protein n=1 Tax=Streptomyces sp. NBC_00846 TaxID=2975849 RepID=UPI00386E2448|nr:hypothetical protein OG936_03055 [Streptomyces sp. NBC_00846]
MEAALEAALEAAFDAAFDAAFEAAFDAAFDAAFEAALEAAFDAAFEAALDAAFVIWITPSHEGDAQEYGRPPGDEFVRREGESGMSIGGVNTFGPGFGSLSMTASCRPSLAIGKCCFFSLGAGILERLESGGTGRPDGRKNAGGGGGG